MTMAWYGLTCRRATWLSVAKWCTAQVDNLAGDGSCPVLLRMACEAGPAGPTRPADAEDWWGACGAAGAADGDEDMVRLRVVREGCAAPRRHELLALKTVAVHCR
jgi:hypothetical protein